MKIEIRQCGYNQGIVINNDGKKLKVKEIDQNGERNILLNEKKFLPLIKKKLAKRTVRVLAAVSIVFIIAITSTISFLTQDTIENKIFDKYYKPMKDNTMEFFIENSAFSEAKRKYMEGEHNVAWLLLSNLPRTWSFETEKIFYQGLTLMELDRFDEAAEKFSLVLESPNNKVIYTTLQWYLGLCHLKTSNISKAKTAFYSIPSESSMYYKKAQRIIKRLEKSEL